MCCKNWTKKELNFSNSAAGSIKVVISGGWSIEAEEIDPPLFFERQEGDQNIKKNIWLK